MTILHIIIILYHEYNLVLHGHSLLPIFFALFFTPTINEFHIEL